MFTMTVHGDMSRFSSSTEKGSLQRGPVLRNGDRKIEGPSLANITLSQSWNGCIWQLQHNQEPTLKNGDALKSRTAPIIMSRDSAYTMTRESPLASSRESPVSLGSCTSSGGDRDRARVPPLTFDDDSATTASSNMDSTGTDVEEEYVTLDRTYKFPRPFRTTPSHHSSMIDLQHNALYTPKVNNQQLAYQNCQTLPNKKFRMPLRSVSVDETERTSEEDKFTRSTSKKGLRRIYENIGEAIKPRLSPRRVGEEGKVRRAIVRIPEKDDISVSSAPVVPSHHFHRSQSVNDINMLNDTGESVVSSDEDEDGDDFGFLSYPFTNSSPAMHKTKSASPHQRILPKRWRSKSKTANSPGSCMWTPEGNCTWCNVSGRKVVLQPISLLQLTEPERITLQKLNLAKLLTLALGCPVVIPKEHNEGTRRKRHMLSFKRSKSANLSGLIHGQADKDRENKDSQSNGLVFGIPLSKCISNDAELLRKRKSSGPLRERKDSDVIIHRQGPRKSSSSSHGSMEGYTQNGCPNESQKRTASNDSLSESETSRNTSSSLIDALSLSTSRQDSLKQDYLPSYATGAPQVPHIVNVCLKNIETYGLQVLGIFRVGSSKKRTKQMRDEFDSGKEMKLNESHNPHEVGSLLKEYFRDLPEPLLTRDLYSPLVATRGLEGEEQKAAATRMLLSLLPVPNRDTLWALLQFLSKVDEHSKDSVDENGHVLPGNKMDAHNLATLFGPNILHKAKNSEKEFKVESMERAEERKEVIDVVKFVIVNHQNLFQVPAKDHDEVLRTLLEADPEAVEQILRRLSNDPGIEPDPDTTSSSLFEDSDTASIPRSPASEADLQLRGQRANQFHAPLRVAKSAEMLTPCSKRKFFYSHNNENDTSRRASEVREPEQRPRFQLRIEGSPSPPEPERSPRTVRSPRVKSSRDLSSGQDTTRPRSMHMERPYSEAFVQNLAIPSPNYMRSSGSNSQLNTSQSMPVRSESFGRSGLPRSGSSSPRVTSSKQRPLDLRRTEDIDPNVGSAEWQKDRWKQWDSIATGKPRDTYEQETLV